MSPLVGVKAGERLCLNRRGDDCMVTVDRVTGTQIIVGNCRYRIKDGYCTPRERWYHTYLSRVSPEQAAKIEDAHYRRSVGSRLASVNATVWQSLPSDDLRLIYGTVCKATKQEQLP